MFEAPSRRGLGVVQAVVSAAALGAVVWWALRQEPPKLPSSVRGLVDLVAALVVYAAASLGRAERWHRILWHNDHEVERADAYRLTAVGYMGNNVLPARAGDLLRVVVLGSLASIPRRAVLGTVVAERLLDLGALALIFGAAALVALHDVRAAAIVAAAAVVAIAAAAAALWAFRRSERLARARSFLAPVSHASRRLVSARGGGLLVLSIAIWTLEAAVYLLVARSIDLELTAPGALYVVALTNLSALVPAAPGYVGTFDAAVVVALRTLGHPGADALGFLLLLRFVLFVPITVVGLGFFLARYSGRGALRTAFRRASSGV